MIDEITELHDSDEVKRLLLEVDATRLAGDLGADSSGTADDASGEPAHAAARLRVAAYVALTQAVGEEDIRDLLDRTSTIQGRQALEEQLRSVFGKWAGYIDALLDAGTGPTIGDLLFYAAAGFLARKPTDVRALLRQDSVRTTLESQIEGIADLYWPTRVRANISAALLFLIRQADYRDVRRARELMQILADDQKEIEAAWLEAKSEPQRDSLTLLGFYHLAHAATLTSEFLLAGSVEIRGRTLLDFGPEMRRLLVKAEEYLQMAGDPDSLFWLNCAAMLLWQLRATSVWSSGRGISERIDRLLGQIAGEGRDNPIFSLLPSQQDALEQRLLDRANVAVVLQMPTSAGKTLLAEFSILQAFEAYKDARVVYITPTRALATQVRRTLAEDLRPLGIQIAAAGGAFEEDPFELHMIEASDSIVVSTPEKLDLLLRTHPEWFSKLRLVVVDEAHLLRDGERGVRLEMLLANLRREQPLARLLLLTPFIENAPQIATWLGETRGISVTVHWRPSRILLGLAHIAGSGSQRSLTIEWKDPYSPDLRPKTLRIPTSVRSTEVQSNINKVVYLGERFRDLGVVLAMFSADKTDAESAALRASENRDILPEAKRTPALRLALALARDEYGVDAALARCLERGVAFHHAALSPTLRYLIEDQVRCGVIRFIAATTTLAQGMNFPVATVLVHSVAKPYGQGNLSPSEFWNIAGRAGRVGMVDRGLVVFVDHDRRGLWEEYAAKLREPIESALLHALDNINPNLSIEEQFETYKELRPFLQYLVHAAAMFGPAIALRNLEELLQASLASTQAHGAANAKLRGIAQTYLRVIARQNRGYLKVVDSTGLGSFSFDSLYSNLRSDPILSGGPGRVLGTRQEGLKRLVEALQWLPELDLAIGFGSGKMSTEAVAKVVQGWIDGQPVHQLARMFPGRDEEHKTRAAAHYIYGRVSQTISWGAHAYIRGWAMRSGRSHEDLPPTDAMLPSYIEHGVRTPEAAVASLLSVPRQLAETFADEYRTRSGPLTPEGAPAFREYLERTDAQTWRRVVEGSSLAGHVDSDDVRTVWRQMQGL
jgi:helicase